MNTPLLDSSLLAMLDGRDLNIRAQLAGFFGGNRRAKTYGSSAEFADYREYQPGDDLRRVDWNLYGRTDQLYLKQFVDERRQHHRFLIDCSASMDWGTPNKLRYAFQLALALGYLAVGSMDVTSFHALQGRRCIPLSEKLHSRDQLLLLSAGWTQLQGRDDTVLDAAVQACPDAGHGDGITFLISDLLTESDWKNAVDLLLEKKQEVCILRTVSRDEMSPSLTGKLLLHDAEAAHSDDRRILRMDMSRQRMKAYAEACAWLENDIRTFCASRNVRLMQLCTDEPVSQALFHQGIESELVL